MTDRAKGLAAVALVALWAVACGDDGSPPADAAGPIDGGVPRDDASGRDAGAVDAATPIDAGTDAETTDAGAGGRPSGGSGGAFPGTQMRTAMLDGTPVPYVLYVPSSYDPATAVPLVSLFHGQGDTGDNILRFFQSTAEAHGFIALATSSTGSMGGWNPSADVPRYDAALTDALGAYDVEQTKLYVWGFSAGAHLAHGIGLANSETFAAYGVNAGVLAAFAGPTGPGRATRRIPVAVRIGTSDPLLPQAQMDRVTFTAAGWVEGDDLDYQEFAGGHTVLPGHPEEMWTFFERWVAP